MASEDVIELGSSDEEPEQPSKKKKLSPKTMVHIPGICPGKGNVNIGNSRVKLPADFSLKCVDMAPSKNVLRPGLTIKPVYKEKHKSIPIVKGTLTKSIITTKVSQNNVILNPFSLPTTSNNQNVVKKNVKIPVFKGISPTLQTVKYSVQSKHGAHPLQIRKLQQPFYKPIPVKTKVLSKLPPGITVKRASTCNSNSPAIKRKKLHLKMASKKDSIDQIMTVNLDDDESDASLVQGPQWYLRPEDQNTSSCPPAHSNDSSLESAEKLNKNLLDNGSGESQNQEVQPASESENNTNSKSENENEPAKSSVIEITIEDSPIKVKENKLKSIIGTELTITVDDSPIKALNKDAPASGSEEEKRTTKEPKSKKELKYPKDCRTIEIEIGPILPDTNKSENSGKVYECEIVEIEESPIKTVEVHNSTPKKNISVKPDLPDRAVRVVENIEIEHKKESSEFHPVYQKFINLCFQLENSEDMNKIVEKKIKSYYRQVPKEYIESETFIDMVSSKIMAMQAGPEKMYLYIKDIVDELNLQRKRVNSKVISKKTKNEEQEQFLYGEDSEFDAKRQRQIRKLEKTLKKIHRAIQKLEEQEVDFDDEEDSVYLLTERYKERMVRVHNKLCQLTNTKMPSEPRVVIDARPGQPKGPAKRLEKWINKKVPIGTPLPFPDFHDVLRCVRDANQDDDLGWNDADIMEEARDLFTRCGKKLQRRRQENEWRLAASRMSVEVDPAENSDDLKKKLEQNKQLAAKKETEVFNKYADRQKQLKLEGEEIGDKEAEESPIESDEETAEDNEAMENSDKRKERLKRLINEKSKKVSEKKEDQFTDENNLSPADNKMNEITNKQPKCNKQPEPNKQLEVDTENKDKGTLKDDTQNNYNNNVQSNDNENDYTLVESDIDELHLLQKLHSENEVGSSNLESSDSDTTIAISDSLSSGDNKKQSSDIISIENSSYSESEDKECDKMVTVPISPAKIDKKDFEETFTVSKEMECSVAGIGKKTVRTNNSEYNESVEDILLASTDDEVEVNNDVEGENDAINLNDDIISIGETVIANNIKSDDASDSEHNTNSTDSNSVEIVEICTERNSKNKIFEISEKISAPEKNKESYNYNEKNITSLNVIDWKVKVNPKVIEIHSVEVDIIAETISTKSVEIDSETNIVETTSNTSDGPRKETIVTDTSSTRSPHENDIFTKADNVKSNEINPTMICEIAADSIISVEKDLNNKITTEVNIAIADPEIISKSFQANNAVENNMDCSEIAADSSIESLSNVNHGHVNGDSIPEPMETDAV